MLPNFFSTVRIHHLIYFAFLVILLPKTGFYFDMIDRPEWISYMKIHGLSHAYASGSNYLPFSLYILYFFGLFFQNPADIASHFYLFKIVVLVFDFAAAIGIAYSFRSFSKTKYVEYLVLANLAYLYNTVFWGQQDGIHSALMVFSLLFLLQNKPILGVLFCILAINTKLQSVILLPIVGILVIPYLIKIYNKKVSINYQLFIQLLLACAGLQLLILLPFLLNHQLGTVVGVMKNSVGFFPSISWGAYNLWYLVTPIDPKNIVDAMVYHHVTYKHWGMLLFLGFSIFALIPLLVLTFKKVIGQNENQQKYYSQTFLTAGVIALLFFFFNTQMHERYAHPALLFYFAYGVLNRNYLLFLLTSVAYFLNLDGIYQYFHLYFKIPLIKPELDALLFFLIIAFSFLKLFKEFNFYAKVQMLLDTRSEIREAR